MNLLIFTYFWHVSTFGIQTPWKTAFFFYFSQTVKPLMYTSQLLTIINEYQFQNYHVQSFGSSPFLAGNTSLSQKEKNYWFACIYYTFKIKCCKLIDQIILKEALEPENSTAASRLCFCLNTHSFILGLQWWLLENKYSQIQITSYLRSSAVTLLWTTREQKLLYFSYLCFSDG